MSASPVSTEVPTAEAAAAATVEATAAEVPVATAIKADADKFVQLLGRTNNVCHPLREAHVFYLAGATHLARMLIISSCRSQRAPETPLKHLLGSVLHC